MKIYTTILAMIKAFFMPKHPDFKKCGVDAEHDKKIIEWLNSTKEPIPDDTTKAISGSEENEKIMKYSQETFDNDMLDSLPITEEENKEPELCTDDCPFKTFRHEE